MGVRQIATLRITQATARVAEHAPLATTCCNACRTCVQTNLVGVALGGVAALAVAVKSRLARA